MLVFLTRLKQKASLPLINLVVRGPVLRMNRPYRQRAPPHESYRRSYENSHMIQERDYYRGPAPPRRAGPSHHQYDAYREDMRPRARRLNDAYPPHYREHSRHPNDSYPPPYREDPHRPNNQYRQPPRSREYIPRHEDYRPRESSYPPPRRRQQSVESVCMRGLYQFNAMHSDIST